MPEFDSSALQALFRDALSHHRAGRLAEAERLYRQILSADAHNAPSLQLLGLIAHQIGRHDDAVGLIGRAITLRGDDPIYHLHMGLALKSQGKLDEAVASYDRALNLKPDLAEAHNNRAVALRATGRRHEALAACDRALVYRPGSAEAQSNRGDILADLGRLDEAVASYDRALELAPTLATTHFGRGNALMALGRLADAIASYDHALALRADSADFHASRADALLGQRRLGEALAGYDRALALKPDFAAAHSNRGNVMNDLGRPDEALASYDRALALAPDSADTHNNRASVLFDRGEYDLAIASFDRAIALRPDFALAHYNRGNAFNIQGRFDEAIASYDRAIALKPDYAAAHCNRGNVFNSQGRFDEAVAGYDRVIALEPDHATAHCLRGLALRNRGSADEAAESFDRALALEPGSLAYATQARLSLPIIMSSTCDIVDQRARYRRNIAGLMELEGTLTALDIIDTTHIFYLAYHGLDDRSTLEAVGGLFRAKAPCLTFEASHTAAWQPPEGKRRIRVGFVSEHFRSHTIERLYRGLIRHLDRTRFEVVLIHAPQVKRDAVSDRLDEIADRIVKLPVSLPLQQKAVAEQRLDVLFYPDIGMSRDTYFLAFARLAPVQAVSWGHPSTSGLDTIDYFVSAQGVEPPDAELNYTERLVRLGRLPCFYERPEVPDAIPGRQELGLPDSGTLYGCPQSLFKFHPEFDPIIADIAAGDPQGHIVIVEGLLPTWTDLLRKRWARNHPALLERVRILPRQPSHRFMALMAHVDVLLDPIHFGSGNTLYEAMAIGTPIVTWQGNFMRGRIVAGAYRQMGIAEAPVAQSLGDYAPLALALGRDPARRHRLRRALRGASDALFADRQAVRDFETFIGAAVDAAARRTRLPAGWRPQAQDGI